MQCLALQYIENESIYQNDYKGVFNIYLPLSYCVHHDTFLNYKFTYIYQIFLSAR